MPRHCLTVLALGSLISLGAIASSALAAPPDFCRGYARAALNQSRNARDHRRCDHFIRDFPQRWSLNYDDHFNWCVGPSVSIGAANDERRARGHDFDACARR